VKFYSARGDVISIDPVGNIVVNSEAGAELLNIPITASQRHLTDFDFLMVGNGMSIFSVMT
jgi:hypothetical protein